MPRLGETMSEDIYTAHKCACQAPVLGVVDGDTDTVYCDICEGVIGYFGDVRVAKLIADLANAKAIDK